MANPNIINATTIYGDNVSVSLTTTSATSVLSNAASSGKVYKIESLVVANTTASAANITINVYSAAALGGTAYALCSTVSVPANASLIVIDKTTMLYLKENQSVGATAGTANALIVTASWEDIS
jgi:hypothetical protein